jgi:hypothetical protein
VEEKLTLDQTVELIECGTIGKEEAGEGIELTSTTGREDEAKKYSWVME